MKYLPFLNGTYSTAPGLTLLSKAAASDDQLVFQIDTGYSRYHENKRACREEGIRKYYLEHALRDETITHINRYIVHQLAKEHPAHFKFESGVNDHSLINTLTEESIRWTNDWKTLKGGTYLSLFDALCSQVQEDLAIFQLTDGDPGDFLTAIHLCSPNHWSPAEKVGKPFSRIHDPVPNMERVIAHYPKMLANIIATRGPYTRFAWGIATDTRLNHHPKAPEGVDTAYWHGRKATGEDYQFFIRSERQNLVGFPEVNAFLFTIRTYFYEVDSLSTDEKKALRSAVDSMSPEALAYKGLTETIHILRACL